VWRGSRICVRRMCEGVNRVLCGGVVRSGWASATLRWTACAFNPRATRSASAPPPSCFYTPIGCAHAHTGRGHTTTWKKLEIIIIKLHVVFHPPPSCWCGVLPVYVFPIFFFPLISTPCLLRVINKYPRIYHITELTIIIKIGISLV